MSIYPRPTKREGCALIEVCLTVLDSNWDLTRDMVQFGISRYKVHAQSVNYTIKLRPNTVLKFAF